MEKFDSLRSGGPATVTIWGPDGARLYQYTSNDYHTIEEAIRGTLDKAGLNISPEDCVFEVTNDATSVSHKYRFNAHGHLKLII